MNKYLNDYLEHYRLDLQFFSKRLIKTAGYVRVSHDEQRKHGFSVEAQIEGLQKYANENGYMIVDWYIDEAKSGRKKAGTRKELMRLIEDAKQKRFNMIIFKCIDRWFRNIAEYYRIQQILEDNNIDWECSEEEYDTTTREGRLKLNLYLMLAQDEADKGSERIKYVFKNKIDNGEAIFGKASLPLGFKVELIDGKKRIVADSETSHIVHEIFDLYEMYKSKFKIQAIINDKYDLDISYKNITTLLKNTLYYGGYKDNDNYVYGEPYLSKERWDNIQEILKSKKSTTSIKRDYLFSCLIECYGCGKRLAGQTTFKKNKRVKDYVRVYYKCNNKHIFKRCDVSKGLPEERVEEVLLAHIKSHIKKYIVEYEIKQTKDIKPKININKLKKEQERLNNLYQKGRKSEEDYEREYQELEDKIKSVHLAEKKPRDISYLKDLLETDIENIYSKLTREERAVFWRSFIKNIKFNHETLEIIELNLL